MGQQLSDAFDEWWDPPDAATRARRAQRVVDSKMRQTDAKAAMAQQRTKQLQDQLNAMAVRASGDITPDMLRLARRIRVLQRSATQLATVATQYEQVGASLMGTAAQQDLLKTISTTVQPQLVGKVNPAVASRIVQELERAGEQHKFIGEQLSSIDEDTESQDGLINEDEESAAIQSILQQARDHAMAGIAEPSNNILVIPTPSAGQELSLSNRSSFPPPAPSPPPSSTIPIPVSSSTRKTPPPVNWQMYSASIDLDPIVSTLSSDSKRSGVE
jgi:hypothetical protein